MRLLERIAAETESNIAAMKYATICTHSAFEGRMIITECQTSLNVTAGKHRRSSPYNSFLRALTATRHCKSEKAERGSEAKRSYEVLAVLVKAQSQQEEKCIPHATRAV